MLARHEATGDAAAAYRERTGGNPFFLDELLRDEGGTSSAGTRPPPPPGMRGVIGRRIAPLPMPAGAACLETGAGARSC